MACMVLAAPGPRSGPRSLSVPRPLFATAENCNRKRGERSGVHVLPFRDRPLLFLQPCPLPQWAPFCIGPVHKIIA